MHIAVSSHSHSTPTQQNTSTITTSAPVTAATQLQIALLKEMLQQQERWMLQDTRTIKILMTTISLTLWQLTVL